MSDFPIFIPTTWCSLKKRSTCLKKARFLKFDLKKSQSGNPGFNHSTTLPIFLSLKSNNSKKIFHFEVPIFLPRLHSTEIFKFLLNSSPSDFSFLEISNSSLGSQVAHFEKHWSSENV